MINSGPTQGYVSSVSWPFEVENSGNVIFFHQHYDRKFIVVMPTLLSFPKETAHALYIIFKALSLPVILNYAIGL